MDKYKITFETWNNIAQLYQDFFMDLSLYNDSYDQFCDYIKILNPNILEIGCGPGNITKYLLSKRPDFNFHATDVSQEMIKLAKINNPEANCEVMDCRTIDTLSQSYNAIICGFCLPYLSKTDLEKLIIDAYTLLSSEGIFYLSLIVGDYKQSGFEKGSTGDQVYVYYYQKEDLIKSLKQREFKIINTIIKSYQKKDGENQSHLIIFAKK